MLGLSKQSSSTGQAEHYWQGQHTTGKLPLGQDTGGPAHWALGWRLRPTRRGHAAATRGCLVRADSPPTMLRAWSPAPGWWWSLWQRPQRTAWLDSDQDAAVRSECDKGVLTDVCRGRDAASHSRHGDSAVTRAMLGPRHRLTTQIVLRTPYHALQDQMASIQPLQPVVYNICQTRPDLPDRARPDQI